MEKGLEGFGGGHEETEEETSTKLTNKSRYPNDLSFICFSINLLTAMKAGN